MIRRNVKWLSFFIFISILSLFHGWSIIKQFHLSAFTVLAVFIYALYSYIRISTFVNKVELNNKFIFFLRLRKFIFLSERLSSLYWKEILSFFSLYTLSAYHVLILSRIQVINKWLKVGLYN